MCNLVVCVFQGRKRRFSSCFVVCRLIIQDFQIELGFKMNLDSQQMQYTFTNIETKNILEKKTCNLKRCFETTAFDVYFCLLQLFPNFELISRDLWCISILSPRNCMPAHLCTYLRFLFHSVFCNYLTCL